MVPVSNTLTPKREQLLGCWPDMAAVRSRFRVASIVRWSRRQPSLRLVMPRLRLLALATRSQLESSKRPAISHR